MMAFFKSTNGGSSWTTSILRTDSGSYGSAVALDPRNPNVVYVGGAQCLYASSDGGNAWTAKASPGGTVQAIAVHPAVSNRIFAGTSSGLYRSEDGGASWSSKLTASTRAVLVNPAAPSQVFAGGANGVYVSEDDGATWTELNAGLAVRTVYGLAYSASRRTLYAATYGGSVFSLSLPSVLPPLNFAGVRKLNRSVLQSEALIDLTWQENPANSDIVAYRLYLVENDAWALIVEVGAATRAYRQRNVDKTKEYRYAITAVKTGGEESGPAYAVVR